MPSDSAPPRLVRPSISHRAARPCSSQKTAAAAAPPPLPAVEAQLPHRRSGALLLVNHSCARTPDQHYFSSSPPPPRPPHHHHHHHHCHCHCHRTAAAAGAMGEAPRGCRCWTWPPSSVCCSWSSLLSVWRALRQERERENTKSVGPRQRQNKRRCVVVVAFIGVLVPPDL